MTSFITETTRTIIMAASYRDLTGTAGVIAMVLLVLLLVQKELLRAVRPSQARPATRLLDAAIVPLLMAFGLIFVMRLVTLLVRGLP